MSSRQSTLAELESTPSEAFIVVLLNAFAALIGPQPAARGLLILSSNDNCWYHRVWGFDCNQMWGKLVWYIS
jgi:hypothetical protein